MSQSTSGGCSWRGVLGPGQFASVAGRLWTPKCHIDVPTRLLVELGRLFGHGSATTPDSVRPHRASSQPAAPFLPLGGLARLRGTVGRSCHASSWEERAHGVRPEPVVWDADFDIPRHGWQRIATVPVHGELVEGSVRLRLSLSEQALFSSQGGPLLSVSFTCFPTSPLSRFDASLFRVLLLRRFWCIPPSSRFCRCGRLLGGFGHRAACAQAGVLESAAARVCCEAGARVTTNVMVRWICRRCTKWTPSATPPWRPGRCGHDVGLNLETGRCAVEDGVFQAGPPSERANVP